MKKVIVAIDSMKGCLGSLEASEACAKGIRKANPEADVIAVPVADGGEGTANAIAFSDSRIMRRVSKVSGPEEELVEAEWWMDEGNKTAYMDMAAAAGLTLVSGDKRNPMKTTTYGVGEMILAAMHEGANRIVAGMGGSATVDGGVGACKALGVDFAEDDIDISGIEPRLKEVEILLACDVEVPFTGERGAARVFGPQKGANTEEVEILATRLEDLRRKILKEIGVDLNEVRCSGAAGGCACRPDSGFVALRPRVL